MCTRENGTQSTQQTRANKVPRRRVTALILLFEVKQILKTPKGFKGFQYKAGAEKRC